MTSNDSKLQNIHDNFTILSAIASELNVASDELTKQISILDEALKKLNIGLTVWVTFCDHSPADRDEYDLEQIGYTKVQGRWGISLRHIWGMLGDADGGEDGPWLFNDAPRDMRIRCVERIPDVMAELSKEALTATKRIQGKTKEVRDLAAAITSAKGGEKIVKLSSLGAAGGKPAAGTVTRGSLQEMLDAQKGTR